MRMILNKGHCIRASDKNFVYHFSIGTLLLRQFQEACWYYACASFYIHTKKKGIPYSQAKDAYLQFFEGAVRFVQNHIALWNFLYIIGGTSWKYYQIQRENSI